MTLNGGRAEEGGKYEEKRDGLLSLMGAKLRCTSRHFLDHFVSSDWAEFRER